MPARQPFTALCQLASRGRLAGRADLHLHTTHSDGAYSPAQVVELARRAGLAAVAVTDHDAVGGVAVARAAAVGSGVEVVAGVEITAEYRGRELHLLGYFFRTDDGPLTAALAKICRGRAERFAEMVERLRACGVSLDLREASRRRPPRRRWAGGTWRRCWCGRGWPGRCARRSPAGCTTAAGPSRPSCGCRSARPRRWCGRRAALRPTPTRLMIARWKR